jgi:hypothetical protein
MWKANGRTDAYPWQKLTWPMARWAKNWPLKDHPCPVCFKLAYWFQRRRFLNITKQIWTKLGRNVPWMVIYKIFVFGVDRKSNMAAWAHNVFWLVEILKIFLLETTKPIELWLCRNDHWVVNFDQSEHIIGPGSHVEFPISTKNKNLVYDRVRWPRPPSKMAAMSRHSFNIEPYGSMGFE